MSEIRFDSEKELVEGIKQSQAYREFVTRGLGHKIEREKEAWRLLTEHRGGYTSKILNHVFDTVDLNQDNKRHFGSLLAKPNRNLIFGSEPSLINQWFEELLFSGREASVSLNACRKKLKIKGASNGLATLLFYLSDPDRYAIWVNATEAGLVVLRRIDKLRGQDWGKNYTQFNGEAMDFWRNHRLQPQETDWFLTFISSCVKSEDSHFRADEEMLSTEQAPIVWRFGAKKGKPEAPTPPVKTEVDVAQRLTQWRQEATDPAHPNYIHADLDQPAKTYATVSRLLQKLREDPDAFGRDDVVALFGALNSGQRMKNKVADENPLPALRQALIALLDGPGTATERIAAADQAIKNASYNMLGELYGWANTETAPLHNGCAIDALHHLGYSFSDKDYTAFVAAHEQFKQVYQQQVGHLRPDLPLNLEIDKFYNVIDKVDLKKVGDSTPSTQRYWIFQGNPKYYDVIGALRDGALKTWQVNQHKKEIQPGDKVIIWVTGENSGCYGLATVMSEVQVFEEDAKEASYRKKPTEKGSSEGVTIRVDKNLWNAPVSRAELDALPGFSDFPAGRQGTNLRVTEAHFKGIQDLVLGRTQMRYWVYAPGPNAKFWDECWQKGIMVYGADELVDLQTYESKDAMEKAFKKALGLKSRPTNDALAAWEFSRVVKPGDVIIAKRGRQQYIGYGIVTGPYVYDTSRITYRNVRTMRWVKKGEWDEAGRAYRSEDIDRHHEISGVC